MKVLMINGSPHKNGCTYTALNEIAKTLINEGIESEIYYIGTEPVAPCRACGACGKLKKCVIDDKVNKLLETLNDYDGYIIGSPVHYASSAGGLIPFLDRLFYANARSGKSNLRLKPGTAIVSARRAGTTATIDQLNKYFQIQEMPVISGRYWNMVHGCTPEEVLKDEEGIQNMHILGKIFVYYLKCKEAAQKAGIIPHTKEEAVYTNFIR